MSKSIENIKSESSLVMIVSLLIVVVFLANYYIDPLQLITTLYKVLVLLGGLVIAGFVFFKSPQGVRLNVFSRETKIELRKVVWPTKDETIKTTGMIMVAVVIVAIFLWIVDAFFTWAVQLLTN
ncbi:Preprotein translocase subunit SecE (TC 3.A.5.1.1) [uncultured Candidatus Thioglobus sp.]|nr:Preprotein translocase subunit SecE (TC 3.A.5.1.1) [uncultured Candidatus Thioglobus sp.]